MNTRATLCMLNDPTAILDRQCFRRATGIPTVSVLVGPFGAGGGAWRRWASATGRSVVVGKGRHFPCAEWVRTVVAQIELPGAVVQCLARRGERHPEEFLNAWQAKTLADQERFWGALAPDVDDDLLRAVASLVLSQRSRGAVAEALCDLGERIVPIVVRLDPSATWPSVLFVSGSTDDFATVGQLAAEWAVRVPAVPIAVAVPVSVWEEFLCAAPESRAKALLKEGKVAVPVVDAVTVERTLTEAGAAGSAVAAIAANGADATLVQAAVEAVRATAAPPRSEAEDDRARSAAERFLFEFLESLPETVGRFELNGNLDFNFGNRQAEVDLLCREPRIAVEIDGYFHFLSPDGFRRDRSKDWELQRRGYLVLRFLAEDVIPQLEMIRDRILEALVSGPIGGPP